jgi:hypothetical protein
MLTIGLTGGIGSGKSSATEIFEKLGTPVIDADIIATIVSEAEAQSAEQDIDPEPDDDKNVPMKPPPSEERVRKVTEFKEQILRQCRRVTNIELPPDVTIDDAHTDEDGKVYLAATLSNYTDIFVKSKTDLGVAVGVKHYIKTTTDKPIQLRPHRAPYAYRQEITRQVKEMLDNDVIRRSNSPWAAPVVLANKKDGSKRFCANYRELNDNTEKDSFPLPRIDETIDVLRGSKFFTTIDLQSGYWQIPMNEDDKKKTAFITNEGLFEFNVMPFGLTNAPATFQRMMQLVLAGILMEFCLCYLDDIIVFSTSLWDHLYDIGRVLQRLREAGLKAKGNKCDFMKNRIHFLGHVVSEQGVEPEPEKIKQILECRRPKTVTEVKSFLGLTGFYRHFVPGYGTIASPLYDISNKISRTVPFSTIWTDQAQEAFDNLKKAMTTPPVLGYPNPYKPFILYTDASDIGIGYILAQIGDDDKEHVLYYGSKKFRDEETRYSITEKECLAVVRAMMQFRVYLLGNFTTIVTDHLPLVAILNKRKPVDQLTTRLFRMAYKILQFEYKIVHKAGKLHLNADAMSRKPLIDTPSNETTNVPNKEFEIAALDDENHGQNNNEPPNEPNNRWVQPDPPPPIEEQYHELFALMPPWDPNTVINAQAGDRSIHQLKHYINHQVFLDTVTNNEKKYIIDHEHQYVIDNNILYRTKRRNQPPQGAPLEFQLVVPGPLRDTLLEQYHTTKYGGHLGLDKVLSKMQRKFYWSSMYLDTKEFINRCVQCARFRYGPNLRAKLQPIQAIAPFHMLGVDVIGPLPKSKNGNQYIVCFMDYFTKWPEAFATKDQTAKTLVDLFCKKIVYRFGVPKVVLSDQGPAFTSDDFKKELALLGTKKIVTAPYHQQANGLVERWNQALQNMIKHVSRTTPG